MDKMLREIHQKDRAIINIEEELKKEKSRTCELKEEVIRLEAQLFEKDTRIRSLALQEKKRKNTIKEVEKSCRARIRRESELLKQNKNEKERRILVLEWVVEKLLKKQNLPYKEIMELTEIAEENDPAILVLLGDENAAEKSTAEEDLIAYLDNNGVKSMLDIKIDRTEEDLDKM